MINIDFDDMVVIKQFMRNQNKINENFSRMNQVDSDIQDKLHKLIDNLEKRISVNDVVIKALLKRVDELEKEKLT